MIYNFGFWIVKELVAIARSQTHHRYAITQYGSVKPESLVN
ncbi:MULTISPECIES: hypothetical protein [unclassified Nostoc]|nr:hypothetical protein [Nostoc sp. KVJ20]